MLYKAQDAGHDCYDGVESLSVSSAESIQVGQKLLHAEITQGYAPAKTAREKGSACVSAAEKKYFRTLLHEAVLRTYQVTHNFN